MGTRWTVGARISGAAASAVAAGLITLLSAPIAGADPADPVLDPAAPDAAVIAPVVASADSAEGVPHLPSPDNLPPGTTQDAPKYPTAAYLRDVWQAIRSNDVSMGDALLLIAQRPMSATPPAGMSPRAPQSPPGADPAPAPEPPAESVLPAEPAPVTP